MIVKYDSVKPLSQEGGRKRLDIGSLRQFGIWFVEVDSGN